MSDDTTITPLRQPGSILDPLTEIAREGARQGEGRAGRAANLPSLAEGKAICLSGHARVAATGNEHYAAHYATDSMILGAGAANTVLPGTTTWREIEKASLKGIKEAKPECYPQAVAAVNAQFAGVPPDQILRGAIDYRTLSPAALNAVKTGSQMINGAVVP